MEGTGLVRERPTAYVPLFIIAGVMHPLAIGIIQFLIPRIKIIESRTPAGK
jgi:hypothetical protein